MLNLKKYISFKKYKNRNILCNYPIWVDHVIKYQKKWIQTLDIYQQKNDVEQNYSWWLETTQPSEKEMCVYAQFNLGTIMQPPNFGQNNFPANN